MSLQVAGYGEAPLEDVDDQSRGGRHHRAENGGSDPETEPHDAQESPHVGRHGQANGDQVGEVGLHPPPTAHGVPQRDTDEDDEDQRESRAVDRDQEVGNQLVVEEAPLATVERGLELLDQDLDRLDRCGEPGAQLAGQLPQQQQEEPGRPSRHPVAAEEGEHGVPRMGGLLAGGGGARHVQKRRMSSPRLSR